jgi:hypothetical protein
MSPLEQLNSWLRSLESRLRAAALSRGLALTAAAALAATVLVVLIANGLSFSDASVRWGRVLLFVVLGLAAAFGLLVPVLKLNRLRAAQRAEAALPELEQRLLTLAEQRADPQDPFVQLLAGETLETVQSGDDRPVVSRGAIAGFASAAAVSAGVLLWLILAGPGFLGHGASLLWAGPSKAGERRFYDIAVAPGSRTVRRKSDQLVTATLIGFQAERVRLFARYHGGSKWEALPMQSQPGGAGYEFLFAGIPESLDYYVEAGGVRSQSYTMRVKDLPAVKNIRVTYRYPKWTGMDVSVEDPGGDLRAVAGTEAELSVRTDRPLERGVLVLDSGERVPLNGGEGRVTIRKDGQYHVAVQDDNELVRLTEDFFIEAREDTAPLVRITRPGRDSKASPIEEVPIHASAEDDFGLRGLTLHYSVNGGPEKTLPLLKGQGKQADGTALLALEEFKLVPGDIVSVYASARDAARSVKTDIYFIQAEPFERNYSQSQQMGGGGEGEGQDQNEISERQKEIISAIWNQLRDKNDRTAAQQNAKFLSDVQLKLRDQAQSLARRMHRRELAGANEEFKAFAANMEQAAKSMTESAGRLKAQQWQEALPPAQQALQGLLRAEAMFRDIQVAFGNRNGGGGGGGGMGRDLESLFELELDTEKNQYETGRQSASSQRDREIDEAMQKLEQLARRQQELAQQAQRQQNFQQRWQQEVLRREAEQLRRRMEQLARGNSSSQQQQGQQQSGSASSQQQGGGGDPRLEQALEQLSRATDDMRRAASPGQSQADARRAAERLQQAQRAMEGAGQERAQAQIEDFNRRAERLNQQQQEHVGELRRLYDPSRDSRSLGSLGEAQKLAEHRQQALEELQKLERDMQEAARNLAGGQPRAASKLRDALGEIQKNETRTRMRYNWELLRRGLGAYTILREAPVTQALRNLQDQLRDAQSAVGQDPAEGRQEAERALAQVEQLRRELEQARQGQAQQGRDGQQPGQPGQSGNGAQPGQRGNGAQPGQRSAIGERDFGGSADGWRYFGRVRRTLQNFPELARKIQSAEPNQLLVQLEQVELELRRSLEGGGAAEVRSGASDRVPPGYQEAVAEYFRRLSQGAR